MYTEEYEKKGFPILRTILKVLIIGIIILLLILFIPKLIKNSSSSNNNGNNGTSGSNSNCSDKYEKSLDALTSQIFADNLEKMKDAAVSYYTTERLPENVGDSDTMTLSDMIGKKLIVALIDKNNKAVDVEKSYVKITKTDEEYILKVNIKDSEKEDYILVHLGCYSYCKTDICEKNTKSTKDVPIKGSKPTPVVTIKKSYSDNPSYEEEKYYCKYVNGKYYDNGGNRVSELTYLKLCEAPVCRKVNGYYFDSKGNNVTKYKYEKDCYSKPTPSPSYKCVYKNGRYYDANGNVVSKVNYLISCEKPKCKIIDGYYFGKNGNVVTKPTYEKECSSKPTPTPTYKCVYKNGKYYDAKGNVVSKVDYLISCEKPKCKIIDGYYFGKNGNVVTKSTYEKECKPKEYEYEYTKTTDNKFSEWSAWSSWSKTDCSTSEIDCNDSDATCLNKLQLLKRKEQIGTYKKSYARERNVVKQTGSYIEKSCSKYNYVEINKTIYATKTTTTYTVINTITSSTQSSTGAWTYNGRASYSNPPRDTNSTHYKFVGADYSYCGDTCTSLPNYYYDSYSYTGGLTKVSSTTVPGNSTSSTTSTTSKEYEASCGGYTYKTIPIYGTITVTDKATRDEPLYGNVCYKSTKNRNLIEKGSTKAKWSSYNDTKLLNSGWTYSGRKRLK